jgi:hypothetical protein
MARGRPASLPSSYTTTGDVTVDYSATPLGRSLEPVLLALCEWGRHHAAELDELGQLGGCSIVSLPEG